MFAAFLAGGGEAGLGQFGEGGFELFLEGAFGFAELVVFQLLAVEGAIVAGQGGPATICLSYEEYSLLRTMT